MSGSEAITGQRERCSSETKEICWGQMSHLVVLVFGYRAPVDIQVLLPDSACAHRLHCSQETWFVRMLFAI